MTNKEIMTRAWEIRKAENTTMSVAMMLAWSESKSVSYNKTVSMTVSSSAKVGDYIVCMPNEFVARYEREVFKVVSSPRFVYSHDEEADYSYYTATVTRVA